jgi:hypothetical protein
MRRLLYVPIIHGDEDMGDIGAALAQRSAALLGEARWAVHQETVRKLWKSIADYLRSVGHPRLKIYQDGLAADGEVGRRIVQEAARRGSRNYQLILELLNNGAELQKTEDPVLLLQERENILGIVGQETTPGKQRDAQQYRSQSNHLMEARDRFIAETINETLKTGEPGVLFIGAQHSVDPWLAGDIAVEMVKDPQKVQRYMAVVVTESDPDIFEALAEYVAAPVRYE